MPGRAWNLKRLRSESGYWRSCILITAAHLDLFGWIGKQEKSPRALTAHFGGSAAGWEIFLNAPAAWVYCESAAASMPMVLSLPVVSAGAARFLLPAYDAWNIWGGLAAALTLGKRPAMQRPFVSDRSKRSGCFIVWMSTLGDRNLSYQEIAVEPLENTVGCRRRAGKFFRCVLSALSESASDPCRTSHVLPLARRAIVASGMARKVRIVGADFSRDALPQGFDTVFVSNVLHAHGVAVNHSLLRKLQRCLNPTAG